MLSFRDHPPTPEEKAADEKQTQETIDYYVKLGLSRDDATIVVERARKASLEALEHMKAECLKAPTEDLQLYTLQLALKYMEVNSRVAGRMNGMIALLGRLLEG